MHRKLHERLKDLRIAAGYAAPASFLEAAARMGHGYITYQRYSALERGDVEPKSREIMTICSTLGITTDMLLIGDRDVVVISGLGHKGRKALLRIADEIRNLEQ